MTDLRARDLGVRANGSSLLSEASFELAPGELVALLGPNGAGKTTLLRAALGLIETEQGHATLGDDEISRLSASQRARRVAYLPQNRPLAWPNCVSDVVALGRFSHGAALGHLSGADLSAVNRAIEACDLGHLADRSAGTLSGGELARVHCARAFASETPLLVADEPVAALDPRHQFRIMDLVRRFVDAGGGALVVLHDISLAARYADRLIWMSGGRIVADGSVEATLTAERLADIYQIRARVDGITVHVEGPI